MSWRFKGFGLSTAMTGPMTMVGAPTVFTQQPVSTPDAFVASRVIQSTPFPSQLYAQPQSKASFPQVLAASPSPQTAAVVAPPQNIVVTLPTVEQRAYAPPAESPPVYDSPAPTYANDSPRPTTVAQPPTFEPGSPSLRPMGLTPVDPATGQAMASTATEAPPTTTGADPSNKGTIALAVGGLALVAGVWFFTR